MQLAKVELFGINICGQQRYSNNNNNTTAVLIITTVNPLVAIMTALCYLCLYSSLYWCVCVCVCVCLGVGSCAHCVLIVWVRFAFSNLFCGLCNLFSLTLHGPNACVSVYVCVCVNALCMCATR